jgi:hypothetical protein
MLRVCEGDRHRRGCHGSESVVAELAGVTLLLVMLMAAAIIV